MVGLNAFSHRTRIPFLGLNHSLYAVLDFQQLDSRIAWLAFRWLYRCHNYICSVTDIFF